jgi:hypothetical protein
MKLRHKIATALTINELFAEAIQKSATLGKALHCGQSMPISFTELSLLLECLPLAQAEFAWAICGVANAVKYAAGKEVHAAAWEIGQLSRRLRTLSH